ILITNKVKLPFDSMEQLVQQTEYKWTLVDGTYYGGFFKAAHETYPDTVQGRMWPLKDEPLKDAEAVVPAALEKKVAVVAPRVFHKGFIAIDFSETGECRLAFTKRGFHDIFLTFAYPKKSPLREPMDMMFLRVIQAGLPDHIQNFELRNATWCTNPKPPPKNVEEIRPFSFGDFLGLFILYILGSVGAFVTLLVECCVHRHVTRRKQSLLTKTSFVANGFED
ncbi:Ionotropic receptor 177, partial [Hyalella azteca]